LILKKKKGKELQTGEGEERTSQWWGKTGSGDGRCAGNQRMIFQGKIKEDTLKRLL